MQIGLESSRSPSRNWPRPHKLLQNTVSVVRLKLAALPIASQPALLVMELSAANHLDSRGVSSVQQGAPSGRTPTFCPSSFWQPAASCPKATPNSNAMMRRFIVDL